MTNEDLERSVGFMTVMVIVFIVISSLWLHQRLRVAVQELKQPCTEQTK